MSGIWDRIIPGGADRCNVHLLKAAMFLAVRGVFTAQQLLERINSSLVIPLDVAAQTDLATIKSAIDAAPNMAGKLDILETFDAMNIGAETGVLTSEAVYRGQLGI